MKDILLRLPLRINKNNGQISSYIAKQKLPKSVVDDIEKQPAALKHLLVEFRGVEND